MAKNQHTHMAPIIKVAGNYIDIHDNNNCTIYAAEPSSPSLGDDSQIDEFRYTHISVTDPAERTQIHRMMCNIVRLPRMQQVCDELYLLMKSRKVLSSINPEAMLKELRRLGLPSEEQDGFSDKNFYHYFKVPKID